MYRRISPLVFGLILVLVLASTVSAAGFLAFFNGFETNTDGWTTVERVSSGTDGIASAKGSYHAIATSGDFTRWGGYNTVFPADGYSTFLDIYLDPSASTVGADRRFDYTSAISTPDNNHRRDFIFNVGTDGTGGYVISASNNVPGWPANPARSPFFLPGGWYTFKHSFYNNGSGVLAVDLSVIDMAGNTLSTWTLSDPSDVIGVTVGGNRYGWFPGNRFDFASLAIDNAARSVSGDKESCKKGGWQTLYAQDGSPFANQGQCIQYFNTGK